MPSLNHSGAGKDAQEEVPNTAFHEEEEAENNDPSDECSGEDLEGDVESSTSDSDGPCEGSAQENGVMRVGQGEPVWTGEELHILAQLKDRWFRGTSKEQKQVVEEAVKGLIAIQPRDVVSLRKKVQRWLKRRAGKRNSYGPGNRPSLQTVLAYYKEAEVTETVRTKYGVLPTGKRGPFLGLWKKELGQLQRALRTEPSRKEEYEQLEAARGEWMRKGPPRERRKKMAEKKATKMVMEFASQMYFEIGARCAISIGYTNTRNIPCVGHFDFNKSLGQGKKDFFNHRSDAVTPYQNSWQQYIAQNLTDYEDNDIDDDRPIPVRSGKSLLKKPEIPFESNSVGEPLLPWNCLTMKLDDRKHLMRCFLKAHYGIAKGVPYPGPGCTPPWARVTKSPELFFDVQAIPDGVELKDPSRMTTEPITKCLTHWLALQASESEAFKFNKVWSDSRGDVVNAVKRTTGSIPDPGLEAEGSKQRKGKGRERDEAQNHQEKKGDIRKLKVKQVLPGKLSNTPRVKNGPRIITTLHDAPGINNGSSVIPGFWPIDPSLHNYPTDGPNDPVPTGYNPVPINYAPPPLIHMPKSPELNPPAWALQLLEKVEWMERRIQATTSSPVRTNPTTSQQPDRVSIEQSALPLATVDSHTIAEAAQTEAPMKPEPTNEPDASSQPAFDLGTGISDDGPPRKTSGVLRQEREQPGPSMPRTWPTKCTPAQTRQQAKRRGVIMPMMDDTMMIRGGTHEVKRETSPPKVEPPQTRLRAREKGISMAPTKDIVKVKSEVSEDVNAVGPAPLPVRNAGPGRKRTRTTVPDFDEPDENRSMPKPRPLRRAPKGITAEGSDTFNLKGRKRRRK